MLTYPIRSELGRRLAIGARCDAVVRIGSGELTQHA